jgi:predicted outer membrane repeat protein
MNRTGLIAALTLLALVLTAPGVALGTTLNVPAEYDSIQAAIDSSTDGDTILVQPGTYTEIVNYSGKNVVVGSLFLTTGDTAYMDSTIIDGNANGRSVVVFRTEEDSSAVLTGFTIRNGDTDYGGGIYIRGASPTISHVVITDCHASRVGGGIYCTQGATPVISNVIMTGNDAVTGGGGFGCYNLCEPVLIKCTVSGNTTTDGGGLWVGMNNQVLLQDTDISDNHADGNGGGIYSSGEESVTTILNCLITGNESGSDGGGIYCSNFGDINAVYTLVTANHSEGAGGAVHFTNAQSSFNNVTFANNSANSGSGIYMANDVSLDLRNCIIWNVDDWAIFGVGTPQEVTVNYCDVQNGQDGIDIDVNGVLNWGDGNIDGDPRFFNADSSDYRLSPGSPCINTGDPDSPLDADSSRADMGALPYHHHDSMIYGYVTIATDGQPIAGATILTSYGFSAITDSAGYYELTDLLTEMEFRLSVYVHGFIGAMREGLFLDEDDTLQVDFSLHRPVFTPSEWTLEAELLPDSATTMPLSIRNDGDYNLRWNAKRAVRGVNAEPWGQMASLDISGALDVSRVNSVMLVEDRYYIAYHSDSNAVAVLDRDLGLVGQLAQFGSGRYGYQDMDWDGELLWGSGERDIYGFTTGGELVKQWGGGFRTTNAIAWDSDRQVLWTGSITGRWIVGYDRDGNSVTSLDQRGMLVYGLAYWADDPDGYPLYILHTPDLERNVIMKMNPATGDTMTVRELYPEAGGKLRSAFICDDYIPTVWTFMAMNDIPAAADRIDVWLLNGEPGWLTIEPVEGEVLPQGGMDLEFGFSAAELDTGIYEADVRFRFPEIATEAVVGATMRVEPNSISDFGFRISDFGLGETYPNPFNSSFAVSYQLSAVSRVNLHIHDISGRLVQTIDEGWQTAGTHRTVINGARLASGVYFLKLAAENRIATRKIVCVK